MKHPDAVVVDVDVVQVVELLQHEVARVVEDVAAFVVVHTLQEHLEGDPVVQVLTRMDLVTDVDPGFVVSIQDRAPAPCQLVERGLYQPRRALRPRIDERPRKSARERGVRRQPKVARCLCRQQKLLNRPGLASRGMASHLRRGKAVEREVIRRVDRNKLALQMGGKLGQLHAGVMQNALDLVTISSAFSRLREIEQPSIPGRNLHALVAVPGCPAGDLRKAVVWRCIAGELREEDRRSLDRPHLDHIRSLR